MPSGLNAPERRPADYTGLNDDRHLPIAGAVPLHDRERRRVGRMDGVADIGHPALGIAVNPRLFDPAACQEQRQNSERVFHAGIVAEATIGARV